MMGLTEILIALGILFLLSFSSYQYIVHREDGVLQKKDFFKLKFEFLTLMIMIGAFFAAVLVFVHGYYKAPNEALRAGMNSGVMLWLVVLGYIDVREKIIPNCLVGIGMLCWLALTVVRIAGGEDWWELVSFSAIGALICGGVLLVISLLFKSAIGMGDVKMVTVLGLCYGFVDTYSILLFSMFIMAVVSIGLLVAKKVTRKTAVPMAPFVAVGFVLSILAGL